MSQATPQATPTQVPRTTARPTPNRRGRYRLHLPAGVDAVTRRRVGDPKPRGRLERNVGVFRLREGLRADGDIAVAEALSLVESDWERQVGNATISAGIIETYVRDLLGFVAVMAMQGITTVAQVTPNMVLAWCLMPLTDGTPAAENTWYRRRSAVRSFFETCRCLGLADANPAKSVEFAQRSGRFVNAFDDVSMAQLKRVSRSTLGDTRTPCALAMVMSGSTTRELANVTVEDVDLAAGRVWVHGGGYKCRDRWVPFTDEWCREAVEQHVVGLRDTYGDDAGPTWLVYMPHPTHPNPTRRAEAASGLITRLLQKARVHQPGQTRAESIREWLALTVFEETGSIEQVALRLGCASLDAAAHLVGYDWVAPSRQDPAPLHRRGGAA